VCVCVCARERERERERNQIIERGDKLIFFFVSPASLRPEPKTSKQRLERFWASTTLVRKSLVGNKMQLPLT
jgi:hypothetical protein